MLDGRYLGVGRFQPVNSFFYTSKIKIFRKQITGSPSTGYMGTSNMSYTLLATGWPSSIVAKKSDLDRLVPGETEIGDYKLVCPFKQFTDGTLIIQDRDIIVDVTNLDNPRQYLVLWAHDPMNTRLHILANLQFGVTDTDLTKQN